MFRLAVVRDVIRLVKTTLEAVYEAELAEAREVRL